MTGFNRIYLLIVLFAAATSGNAQSKRQHGSISDIKISSERHEKLDFSHVDGSFDKVYGNVHNGFRDKAGNLWFGTTGAGAVRFDGKFFTHFTTKDKSGKNSVTPLLEDHAGNIWFSTGDGIYRYDGENFTSVPIIRVGPQSFTLNSSPGRNAGPLSVISAMQDRKGNIWIGTELSGVYRYDGRSFTPFLSQGVINDGGLRLNTITNILEDRQGNIWFASWNNEGLCRYSGQGKSLFSFNPKNGLGDNMIHSLFEDKSGNIWIGTRDHGVWRYDHRTFTDITKNTALKEETIYAIRQDKTGNLWFSTQSKGVWRYDVHRDNGAGQAKSFTNFTTKDGLSNNSVFCIVTENDGNLWFGTRGMGLSRYHKNRFTNFTGQNGPVKP